MGRLDGQVAVVTGGASGIGRGVVDAFVSEGARVVVLDRSADALTRLEADWDRTVVRGELGDVTDLAANTAAVERAGLEFGHLDVFVGNAGLWDFNVPLLDIGHEDLPGAVDELFAVNVKAYILGARAATPALRETRGSVIYTLSNAAFYPGGGGVLYTASKHAGVGLVRQLAYELAPDVRVNGVAPGGVGTDLRGPAALRQHDTSITEAMPIGQIMRDHLPLGIEPQVEDYVAPYVLLASRREARVITGAVFQADGGVGVRR